MNRKQTNYDHQPAGVLSGIGEVGPKAKAVAVLGAIALVPTILLGQRLAEVASPNIVHHHTHVDQQGPNQGNSLSHSVTFDSPDIGK